MNITLEELKDRKSIRVYEDRIIEPENKKAILNASIQAPTAGNMSLYTILDITDQALKDKLSITCDNQPFIAKAPLVLIFCCDYQRWYDVFCKVEKEVRKPSYGDFLLAVEDTLIAAQNAVVAAQSLGIGSCYIGDILEQYEVHKELLSLPQYVKPIAMLCFGYPTKAGQERIKPPRFKIEDIVHENVYSKDKSDNLMEMIRERDCRSDDELVKYLQAFCKRKWNCDFSQEMSRSVEIMLKEWTDTTIG